MTVLISEKKKIKLDRAMFVSGHEYSNFLQKLISGRAIIFSGLRNSNFMKY